MKIIHTGGIAWAVLVVLFAACLLVLAPFLSALIWAAILSYSMWPLYRRLLVMFGGRRTLAALFLCLSLTVLVIMPFAIVVTKVVGNVDGLRATVDRWLENGLPPPPAWLQKSPLVGQRIADYWQGLSTDGQKVRDDARRLVEPVSKALLSAGMAVGSGLVQMGLSILMLFFLLRDGSSVAEHMTAIINRIGGERGKRLLFAAGDTVRGVVYGILGTALLQAALAAIAFILVGVPGFGLLVVLTFMLSIVPLGPPLVFIPVAMWLFSQGATGWGIFMILWGFGVGSVDNFVRPWLISKGSDMPFLLIFLGVVGGAFAFGLIGVFLGPTLLSVSFRLIQEWISDGLNPPAAAQTIT